MPYPLFKHELSLKHIHACGITTRDDHRDLHALNWTAQLNESSIVAFKSPLNYMQFLTWTGMQADKIMWHSTVWVGTWVGIHQRKREVDVPDDLKFKITEHYFLSFTVTWLELDSSCWKRYKLLQTTKWLVVVSQHSPICSFEEHFSAYGPPSRSVNDSVFAFL